MPGLKDALNGGVLKKLRGAFEGNSECQIKARADKQMLLLGKPQRPGISNRVHAWELWAIGLQKIAENNVLSKFIHLSWATFIAILGLMWLVGSKSDLTAVIVACPTSFLLEPDIPFTCQKLLD